MINVLFVCLGNICRSPTAHGVLEHLIKAQGLSESIHVDSCGTGAWHIGQSPDERTQAVAKKNGYDLSLQRARRIEANDFTKYDYILAMDARNLADVLKKMPADYAGRVQLFLDYSSDKLIMEVPDPYYGGEEGFQRVLQIVESTCKSLLDHLKKTHDI